MSSNIITSLLAPGATPEIDYLIGAPLKRLRVFTRERAGDEFFGTHAYALIHAEIQCAGGAPEHFIAIFEQCRGKFHDDGVRLIQARTVSPGAADELATAFRLVECTEGMEAVRRHLEVEAAKVDAELNSLAQMSLRQISEKVFDIH